MSLTREIAELLADPNVLKVRRSPYGYLVIHVTDDHPIWSTPPDDDDDG